MCIPHGATASKSNGYIEDKPKKHVTKVSQSIFEKGDPSFVDERVNIDQNQKKKKSFLESFFEN